MSSPEPATPKKLNVGLIGVGLMGHGIATNIVKHGHSLSVLDHAGNQPLDALRAAGVRSFARPAELAAQVDLLLLCVTGSPQVEAVLLDTKEGALLGLKPGAVVIDLSTAIPASTERLAGLVEQAGGRFMDSAMTRTPKEAAEGRLNLLVGAEPALFEQVRPLLACFAENITLCGPVGSGHRMKLLHNYVSLGTVALIAEAAAHAERAQVAPEVLVDVLAKGGGGGVALERLKPFLLARDATGLRFAMSNAVKDLGYYAQMAQDSQAARAIAEGVKSTYERGVAEGSAETLVPELIAILAKAGEAGR
ncbi:NAD(P)-dependent oxidoreductase [Variovorax sp. OV329]|uniref:NAD(P)-dependent oxidoreductase n=1 Tax=Variovorax sp. OV329 TaxID=1882825 RepID=UPI0008DF6E07|nr:NAD(P)-dependent oxidoreductase [Variovorax sp. OV329]SFM87423.1 3-hydroxyisobutyrate dehydrogenase [Variovorax sp. OV329]